MATAQMFAACSCGEDYLIKIETNVGSAYANLIRASLDWQRGHLDMGHTIIKEEEDPEQYYFRMKQAID